MNRRKKLLFNFLIFGLFALILAGCSNNESQDESEESEGSTEITFVNFMAEQEPLFEKAIKMYQEENPDVTINLQTKPYDGYMQYLRTQLVGGTAPEIMFAEYPDNFREQDLVISLDKYLDEPNPYSESDQPWKEEFLSPYFDLRRDADGKLTLLPWSVYNIGVFYNQDMFEEAGVAETPKTWSGWMDTNKKLKESGETPLGIAIKKNDAQSIWILEGLKRAIFRDDYEQINIDHGEGWEYKPNEPTSTFGESLTLEEIYIAYHKGILDPAKSEKIKEVYELYKQLVPYMNEDAIAIDGEEVYDRFLTEKNAQFANGTWFGADINRANKELRESGNEDKVLNWGQFSFPEVTKDTSEFFTMGGQNPNAKVRNGFLVKNSEDESKTELAVDFLQFMTSPDVANQLFSMEDPETDQRYVYDFPAIEGVSAIEGSELPQGNYADLNIWLLADAQDEDAFWRQMQEFVSGKIAIDEFLQKRSESFGAALERRVNSADEFNQELVDQELN